MSFQTKLSLALAESDNILIDNMEVFSWYPRGTDIVFEFGEDREFPDRIVLKDEDISVNDDGEATVRGEDPDGDDVDDDEPAMKDFTVTFMVNRPLTEKDMA